MHAVRLGLQGDIYAVVHEERHSCGSAALRQPGREREQLVVGDTGRSKLEGVGSRFQRRERRNAETVASPGAAGRRHDVETPRDPAIRPGAWRGDGAHRHTDNVQPRVARPDTVLGDVPEASAPVKGRR